MEERAACALLKARFVAAGFAIEENRSFSEADTLFEIDGYDPERRVGYEYITEEAGDSWDVDEAVIAKLNAARNDGVFILVIDEKDCPDAASLGAQADAFLAELDPPKPTKKPAAKPVQKPAAKPAKKPAKKPAAKTTKQPAAKQPAAKKSAAKTTKNPAAKQPAARKK